VSSLDFTVVPAVAGGTTVTFQWTGTHATSYQVEIGSTSGGSDVATLEAAAPPFTWSGAPVGTFYARVRGKAGGTLGAPTSDVTIASVDARLVIDALIFGNGPLAVAGNAAGPWVQDRMDGWMPGSAVEIRLAQSVPVYVESLSNQTAAQIGPATRGAVTVSVEAGRFPDPLPDPARDEITVSQLTAAQVLEQCRCEKCVGCAWTWHIDSRITRSKILLSDMAQSSAVSHEIGHAIGLSHIIVPTGMRPAFAMGFTTDGQYAARGAVDVFDPATVKMLETLYGAGFTSGASRRQFEAAGFVPSAVTAGARDERRRPAIARQDGEETVVVRPLCGSAP